MDNRKIKIPQHSVRAAIVAESFNEEDRTVEVVWTTGSKGKRFSFSIGEFFEELSLKKDHVNLDRLNQGAPVLNSHNSHDLRDNLGVVEKAWIRSKEGRAKIRFSSREEIQGIVNDVRDKVIRNLSVGYRVERFEDVSKKGDEIPTLRAVAWTPMEISFVNIGFDKDAQVRSETESYEALIIRQEDPMDEKTKVVETSEVKTEETREVETTPEVVETAEATETVETVETVDAEAIRAAAEVAGQEKEMARQESIRSIVTSVKLGDEVAERLIKEKKNTADANAEVIRILAGKNSETKTVQTIVEVNDVDNKKLRRDACTNAIQHLYGAGERPQLTDGAREFCGHNILDVASRYMESEGINVRELSRRDIAKLSIGGRLQGFDRTHTSSDFPFIVADVTNKTLQREYADKPQTFAPFVTERAPVSDFKILQSTKFGDAPNLEEVNEKGEYKEGTVSEGKEEYKIKKYGKMVSVSEELLMNDDLGAVLKLASKFGRRSRELESDIVWGIINTNAAMGDGNALFSAPHGNLAGAASIIDVANIGLGRLAMRQQTGLDGAKIEMRPVYLVVPSALETFAEQFLGATVPVTDTTTNPFKSLRLVSEVRLDDLSATAWYLMGDSGQSEMIETVKMRGFESPSIETQMAFETDVMKMKVKYYFAAKALDWVGFYKNAGL